MRSGVVAAARAGAGLLVAALSCHGASDTGARDAGILGTPGAVGASVAVVQGGAAVAVVNPDQGSVSFLDPSSLALQSSTAVAGEPHALLEVTLGGAPVVLVATYRGGEVVAIDESSGAVTRRVSPCAGPYGLAASPDGTWVAVSCEWDGTVQRIDLATFTASVLAKGLHRPRALAVLGTDVFAGDYVGGLVHALHADGTSTPTTLVPAGAPYRPALTQMSANLVSAIVPAFGQLFVSHVLENNTGDQSVEPEAEDYGSVTSTNPKINPSVTPFGGSAPVLYAVFDGGSRVYSGPEALAPFGGRYLLVAHGSTANVAVLDTQATTPEARAVGTFRVGAGPMGVAVDSSGKVAYVDNAFDQSVSRLDLEQPFASPAPVFAATTTLVRTIPSPYTADALAGRRLFWDATNPHVTPSGVVACASCHPGGTDDGLVWFIHTANIPPKRRRTPHLGNSRTETAPFHWNGQFATMSDLVENTMTNLMAGDGLLVDVDTIQPYIDQIVKPPVLPVTDAASVARGSTLFHSDALACAACHSGTYFTDDLLHTVLDPMSLDSEDVIPESNTPGLFGLFLRAPYFHDGRAATLLDVLTMGSAAPMDHTTGLSQGDLDDLVAYMNSL